MVALRKKSFLINLLSSIYMWIDFPLNVIDYVVCDSIIEEFKSLILDGNDELNRRLFYFIAYKISGAVPLVLISSFIAIILSLRAFESLITLIKRNKTYHDRIKVSQESRDTCFCLCCNVSDNHEVIFSKCDLMYTIDLLKSPEIDKFSADEEKKLLDIDNEIQIKNVSNFKVKSISQSRIEKLFRKHVYDWDSNFHFTSRFLNTMVVAFLALYFFFLFFLYNVSMGVSEFESWKFFENLVDEEKGTFNTGLLISVFLDDEDKDEGEETGGGILSAANLIPSIPLSKQVAKFMPQFGVSLNALFIVPIFGAMFICSLQFFFLIRESKKFMIELYKGKCEFVKSPKYINNGSVFSSSFHFGG